MPSTSFTDLMGCATPIQQAPMGGISPPRLARAVAIAGGVGTISVPPGGELPIDLDQLVAEPGVFAVNFVGEDFNIGQRSPGPPNRPGSSTSSGQPPGAT